MGYVGIKDAVAFPQINTPNILQDKIFIFLSMRRIYSRQHCFL